MTIETGNVVHLARYACYRFAATQKTFQFDQAVEHAHLQTAKVGIEGRRLAVVVVQCVLVIHVVLAS